MKKVLLFLVGIFIVGAAIAVPRLIDRMERQSAIEQLKEVTLPPIAETPSKAKARKL